MDYTHQYGPFRDKPSATTRSAGIASRLRSTVVLCPFVTHRHPEFWEKPNVFDPDRFALERAVQRPKGAYFPFLSGPHQCIGNQFAMLEMRLIVAMVLKSI